MKPSFFVIIWYIFFLLEERVLNLIGKAVFLSGQNGQRSRVRSEKVLKIDLCYTLRSCPHFAGSRLVEKKNLKNSPLTEATGN